LLAYVPLSGFLVPSEILRKVLIGDLLCTLQSPIGNEPLCERSLFDRLAIHNLLSIIIIIEIDHMLIYEMDRQTIDRWFLFMHREFHCVPDSCNRANVMGIHVIHYLIHICHLQSCTVMTLVYIFVNVLDSLDSGTDLYIDVTVILCRQPGIIRNNVTVVKCVTSGVGIGSAIVWPGIFRIAISTKAGCGAKFLGKMLAALTIDHASCSEVSRTTGAMDHALCDGLIEHGLSFRVRDLGRNNGVNMKSITDLELLPQEDEEMDMRQTPLLELYGEDKAKDISKQTTLYVL
jgi:hypothetical protein